MSLESHAFKQSTRPLQIIYYIPIGLVAASVLYTAARRLFLQNQQDDYNLERRSSASTIVYQMLRCCCCFTLFSSTLFLYAGGNCGYDTNPNLRLLVDCVVYAYTSLLAVCAILLRSEWSKFLSAHLEAILLSSSVVYGFDTVLPAIVSAESWQSCEDSIHICVKITALLLGAVLLPLLIPRHYVPADPKNPSMFPNPEQTASLLSLIFFSYLDSIVWKASKVPHLSTEALPPLCDNDQARILRDRDLAKIDPLLDGGKRHVFLNLLHVFPRDVAGMSVALICHSMASFLPAVSTNRLLVHLERSGSDDRVPAWVWIILLFVGPVASSSAIEWYMRVILKAFVRTEALLTQLIFAHAVRARVKSDVRDSGTDDPKAASAFTANINTLITVDLNTMNQGLHFLVLIVYLPIQLTFCIVFLYKLLGWSAFVGIGLTVALSSIPGIVGKSLHSVQEDKMKKTDFRVRFFTDVVNVLRMVKLFGWEEKMSQRITEKRIVELKASQKARLIELLLIIISFVLPFATMLVTFACYTLVAKGVFSPSIAFPALVVFENFRNQIQVALVRGTECITAKVSLDRINKFLQDTELLDAFVVTATNDSEELSDKIGFSNASFTWSNHIGGIVTPSGRRFILSVPGTLYFKRNALNLITGPTGSGKTSLLLALLGEMHQSPSTDSWFNLPRAGGMAYAAQESWVLNETIRENILFGSPYNEERYRKVIKQCALEQDLTLFAAGDQTEIGEKGLSVSGGQKARLTLARAVYSQAEILILDDILAALDVHTSKWIVEEALSGDLVKSRTVIMVSHNVTLLTPLVQCFITMKNGVATASDNIDGYIELSRDVLDQAVEGELDPQTDVENENNTANSKLIVSEEIHEGSHVGRAAIALYTSGLGGKHPVLFFTFFFACLFAAHFISIVQTWFLSYWAEQYDSHAPTQVSAPYYLGIYGLIFLIYVVILSSAHVGFILASVKASESIHNQFVESILAATFRWLDETPISRIITRATQDIGSVDLALPLISARVCDFSIRLLFKIGALVVFTPTFVIPSAILAGLGIWIGSVYLNAQSSIKREMSIAKAPVVGLIGAASTGIISVRAYSAQNKFTDLLIKRIDHYSRSAIVFYGLQRWMAMRTETLAGLFCAGLAGYLVYCTYFSASEIGFLLNLAVDFSSGMVWWVISVNGLEAESNCLERIESYLRISHEAHLGDGSLPPAHWPSSGELRVENLTARYSLDGPQVLHGLSFQIKSGERIGVVGRTGSGKSTLTLALLRCILTEGSVFYDGILTSALNLDALRSQITIIPQTPELISGSLRQNLDPFEEHDDLTLNRALKSAGLDSLQEELDVQDRVNLETLISDGGKNLSVGQRQIIALARAIIRRSKVLILDEATSAIDYKTDTIIQKSLRTEYKERGGDATIITIAHRLQTVLDTDRIMVLDTGRIVEFDSPQKLLQKEGGQFRAMVEEAHDKDVLLAMVNEGSSAT